MDKNALDEMLRLPKPRNDPRISRITRNKPHIGEGEFELCTYYVRGII